MANYDNLNKLTIELLDGGLAIHGIDCNGVISWHDGHPTGTDEADAQAIIDAHDPTDYDAINREDAKARFLLSQLANKTPEEIYTLMQGRMDSWTTLGDARDDLREWLPLIAAVMAWKAL